MVEKEQLRKCCAHCWRVVFIILNILFFLIGLALIAFGIYLLATENTLTILTGNNIASGGALILIAGIVTGIISFVGILGAAGMWPVVLGFYIALMVIIIILEVTAAILGFVFQNELEQFVGDRVNAAIGQYTEGDSDINTLVDFVQNTFRCCGLMSSDEWLLTSYFNETEMFPGSCNCTEEMQNNNNTCMLVPELGQFIWARGCNESVSTVLASQTTLIAVGVVGVVFGLVELFGLGVAIGLCACFCIMKREDSEYGKPI